nr:hypothetical protein [Nanoarchaeota archaeon]
MSLNNLGKNNPMYGKRGNLNHMYGKISPMLGKTHTKETKKKISLANYGKTHTKETKRKMSLARIGKKLSEETKKKLSVANKGKIPWHKGQIDVYSKESNLKRSETHKKILHRAKNYILISPEGIEIKVFNLNGFCNDNDLSIRCMTQVVCGRQKQHKGWKFKEKW